MTAPARDVFSVTALRQAFDNSFATVVSSERHDTQELLLVRVAGDPYVIRLRDITGLVAKQVVIPIPSHDNRLLGLAGIRGNVVPVFGLAPLLGYAGAPEAERWMVLCATPEPIALAFAEFEGYARLDASDIHRSESARAHGEYATEIARMDVEARPIINIRQIVAAISHRDSHERPPQE